MNPPDFIVPYLDQFYDPKEQLLLKVIDNRPIEKTALCGLMINQNCFSTKIDFQTFIKRAWKKGIIHFLNDGRIVPADFHARFDYWAMFEGWKEIPKEIKSKLLDWELNYYVDAHQDQARQVKEGKPRNPGKIYPEYILFHEVELLFNQIPTFYLWPCNCRSMVNGCKQKVFTCIRFSNDRGIGWEISREKALSIVKKANKNGLMQSAELALDENGSIAGALCNCCSDCCFPNQLADKLGLETYWPLSRYQAMIHPKSCKKCGKCVSRCPFNIISQLNRGRRSHRSVPEIAKHCCRGCGVCATGCPQNAIEMDQIKSSEFDTLLK